MLNGQFHSSNFRIGLQTQQPNNPTISIITIMFPFGGDTENVYNLNSTGSSVEFSNVLEANNLLLLLIIFGGFSFQSIAIYLNTQHNSCTVLETQSIKTTQHPTTTANDDEKILFHSSGLLSSFLSGFVCYHSLQAYSAKHAQMQDTASTILILHD